VETLRFNTTAVVRMERTRIGHTVVGRVTLPESPGASPWDRDDCNDAGSSFLAGMRARWLARCLMLPPPRLLSVCAPNLPRGC
jgi:hypothetical protein